MTVQAIPYWNSFIPSSLTLLAFSCILVTILLFALFKRHKFVQRVDKVPGPPARLPIIGNTLDILVSPDELFSRIVGLQLAFRNEGPVIRAWAGPFPMFFLTTAEGAETLLTSNKLIDKSREYDFLHPWLNTGLLTSTGSKWHGRRKMLTPAFHFKILEDFVSIFNEQSLILIDKLREALKKDNSFNICPFITRCTLDIICESAMGRHVGAQHKDDSEYVQAVYKISRIVQTRQARFWLQLNWIFNASSYAAEQKRCLTILHGFTDQVIRERKIENKERARKAMNQDQQKQEDDDFVESKRRLAFLDLLIEASDDGRVLSDTDIREEVDTFMFEGHDTTSVAISWSLMLIGSDPRVQDLVNEELNRVLGTTNRPISMVDLAKLKYLECCIKEALRLYPSVPILGRELSEDTTFHQYDIPAGTTTLLLTYVLHRDPKNFPDPELYKPERFLPENISGRHPFSYVPFSAGPRNCIGQKFALMEEKVILATIFRNFHVETLDKREDIVLLGELILRPRDGVRLRLTPKKA